MIDIKILSAVSEIRRTIAELEIKFNDNRRNKRKEFSRIIYRLNRKKS